MTIEIHSAELESILRQRLLSGHFESVEDMLLETFKETQPPATATATSNEKKAKALEAASSIRELRKGVRLNRPEGTSLRDYAHIGHRY